MLKQTQCRILQDFFRLFSNLAQLFHPYLPSQQFVFMTHLKGVFFPPFKTSTFIYHSSFWSTYTHQLQPSRALGQNGRHRNGPTMVSAVKFSLEKKTRVWPDQHFISVSLTQNPSRISFLVYLSIAFTLGFKKQPLLFSHLHFMGSCPT